MSSMAYPCRQVLTQPQAKIALSKPRLCAIAAPVTLENIYELFRISQARADRHLERLEQITANTGCEVAEWVPAWDDFTENLVELSVARLFQSWMPSPSPST